MRPFRLRHAQQAPPAGQARVQTQKIRLQPGRCGCAVGKRAAHVFQRTGTDKTRYVLQRAEIKIAAGLHDHERQAAQSGFEGDRRGVGGPDDGSGKELCRNGAVGKVQALRCVAEQLAQRLVSAVGRIDAQKLRKGQLDDDDWDNFTAAMHRLEDKPIFIDDTPSISVYELRSKVRRLVRNAGVKLIIIDYLQLMTGPPELRGMREQEVSNISRSLKAIAKEMSIPVIALSQLSRDVEKRGGNKIPQLSDLRESGAIEQDADIVMFIHRPDYYGTEEEGAVPGQAQIIIAKHRNGSTDVVPMIFRKNEARFVDSNDGGFLPPEDDIEGYKGVESSMNNSEFEEDF